MRKLLLFTYAIAFALLLVPSLLFAQDARPDLNAVAVDAINALVAPTTLLVLWALKAAWSKIPASIVIFAAPVVGMGINYALSYLAGHPPASPVIGALLGMVATYAREFGTTLASKGLTGPVTLTKLNF